MALKDLLELSDARTNRRVVISEDLLKRHLDDLRNHIAFFREYPDYFVDFMKGPDSKFKLYTYQRIFLRIAMRHKYVYATFPRAFSKSFLSMLILMIRCILFPGSHLFVTTGGKEQASSITISKIEEICKLIPAFRNELNLERGKTKNSKNDVSYIFKCGSSIDVLAATERSRGQRRTGGLLEECVLIDQTALNEIIIPTTNVDRYLPDGKWDRDEVVNQSQIYITTAGFKNSFAFDKLIELLIQSLIDPDLVMVMGGTCEIPILEGLLKEDFVDQLRLQGTFNEDSFDREYNSKWSGDAENAFYSSQKFDKYRVLLQPEYEYSGRSAKSAYYILGVDVGRFNCTSEVCIFKNTPQAQGSSIKSLVNVYSLDAEHFEDQAIFIKKLFYKYKARTVAIDGNGLGAGLVDYMVRSQVDPETGDVLPPFGVENDDDGYYKKYRTPDTEMDAMFIIKANAPINTEAYSYAQTQMSSGKVKFLIDEQQAKTKLMSTKVGQNMSSDQRNDYLQPYVMTTILREQMLNLVEENEGVNIILKQSSKSIKKDKFSAFVYGLYYIKLEEDRKKKRRGRDIKDFMFFN